MFRVFLLSAITLLSFPALSQRLITPLEYSGFTSLTTHKEMMNFLSYISTLKGVNISKNIIAVSPGGRDIPVLEFSLGEFGKDPDKLKVLLFAQQHGSEHSGKEAALLLIGELANGALNDALQVLDVAVIPMMNPDGNEVDRRRNGNNADLNRDHLILEQPENIGLQKYFYKYLFDVSMDVHEYYPYSEDWIALGFRKNSDVTVGCLTNINTPQKFRDYANEEYLPFVKDYLNLFKFSFAEYTPAGIPESEYMRYSTFDINDGRQGFGSLATFSFIQEGKNGEDSADNIERRAYSQMVGMIACLQFSAKNHEEIKELVKSERIKLAEGEPEFVSVQMEHTSDGSTLELPVISLKTDRDSVVSVKNFRPVVSSLFNVRKPFGYLIPVENKDLVEWTKKHHLETSVYEPNAKDIIESYYITGIDSIDFEGDRVINPSCKVELVKPTELKGNYLFVPTKQLAGNIIVQALEPKSMIGLATYKKYENLVTAGTMFPILRLVE
ncbi:MAG: hypothetical protein F9K26_00210 [Ignavibacteriaceae bacterium]|nr:MAG: hypothetical protein F9K26_00210 [Ignavibacteriaceae bacterium]MBZ0195791.1 hypothetical protein [Ignavibacteriaceae bacterium]